MTGNLSVPSDVAVQQQQQPAAAPGSRRPATYPAVSVPKVVRQGLILVGTGRVMKNGDDGYSTGRLLVFEVEHARDSTLTEEEADVVRRVRFL